VNITGNRYFNNTLTINTLNDYGMSVVCHSTGCSGDGIAGNGWQWSGIQTISILFGDGDDVVSVTDIGLHIMNQSMTLNGGGGTDLFSIVSDKDGFNGFTNGQLTLLDFFADGSDSDGTSTLDVDMCKLLIHNH
jgi:hypothetical protein